MHDERVAVSWPHNIRCDFQPSNNTHIYIYIYINGCKLVEKCVYTFWVYAYTYGNVHIHFVDRMARVGLRRLEVALPGGLLQSSDCWCKPPTAVVSFRRLQSASDRVPMLPSAGVGVGLLYNLYPAIFSLDHTFSLFLSSLALAVALPLSLSLGHN